MNGDLVVQRPEGLYCPPGDFYIDPWRPVARAVITRPELLVADEPTGNVDAEMAQRLLHLFTALNRLGTTIVVATHDVGLIGATPGAQLIRLENGTMVDPTGALKNPPVAPQLRGDLE